MMFCVVGEMDWEKLWKGLWKGGLGWMKRQRWDLKGRKWEQVNVPQILFLSKQDVLWCFIYKATKAQKAGRVRRAAKSTVCGTGRKERKRGWDTGRERDGGGGQMILYTPQWEKTKTWKLTKGKRKKNSEPTKLQSTREETETEVLSAWGERKRKVSGVALQWWRRLMQHAVTSALQQSWAQHQQANLSSVAWNELHCNNDGMCGHGVVAVGSAVLLNAHHPSICPL